MGDGYVGADGLGSSARSLFELVASFERELALLFTKAGDVGRSIKPARGLDLAAILRSLGDTFDTARSGLGQVDLAGLLGLADAASLEAVRSDLKEMLEELGRLKERESVLAEAMSRLRGRTAHFEESLAGLARAQGRWHGNFEARAERGARREGAALEERLVGVETGLGALEGTQKSGARGLLDGLENTRDRIVRLETRAAEMSREAKAKTGRLDALARHVASVEGRLVTAMGAGGPRVSPRASGIGAN